jgi:hypothetical protein
MLDFIWANRFNSEKGVSEADTGVEKEDDRRIVVTIKVRINMYFFLIIVYDW